MVFVSAWVQACVAVTTMFWNVNLHIFVPSIWKYGNLEWVCHQRVAWYVEPVMWAALGIVHFSFCTQHFIDGTALPAILPKVEQRQWSCWDRLWTSLRWDVELIVYLLDDACVKYLCSGRVQMNCIHATGACTPVKECWSKVRKSNVTRAS